MSSAEDFNALMTLSDPSMVVATTADDRERAGCLVGFHAQSGLDPGSFSIWLSKANHTFRVAVFAQSIAVHFLTADDLDIATTFGTLSGDQRDKFALCDWQVGPDGVPLLDACPNRIVGRKVAVLDTRSDHVCVVLDPIEIRYAGDFTPLRLSDVVHLRAGHEAEERPQPQSTRVPDAG